MNQTQTQSQFPMHPQIYNPSPNAPLSQHLPTYLQYCRYRKELDDKTLKAYRIDLTQYFAYLPNDTPAKAEIEDYITYLHKHFKQKTVKRKIASLKAFYNYLEEQELISENPLWKIKVKFKETITLPRIIPRNEIEQLLNYMYAPFCKERQQNEKNWLRDIAVTEVFFAIGARVYEVSNIRADCVDLYSGLIRIMGKGGKERYIQIGEPAIITLLQQYYDANKAAIDRSGYFFVNQRGERFSEQSIRLMMKKYAKAAGIERNITPHMFRHSFATYLIEEGVDISCVQQILGHSSIKTTQIYIHVAAGKQAEIIKERHPRNHMHITGLV